jgi:hypothetical protein
MSIALCVALTALGQGVLLAQQAANLRMLQNTSLDKMRESVNYWERMLAREMDLQTKGVSSESKVDSIRVVLAKYRHDLAIHEKKSETVLEQSRLVLAIRERQLKRLQKLADLGIASELEITEARRHLACAQYFLAVEERNQEMVVDKLKIIVDLCSKEVRLLEKLRTNTISSFEFHRAESRLISAQYLLTKTTVSSPEEIMKELRRRVEVCEKEWKQIVELKRQGAAMIYEVYYVRLNLLNAKLRLANVEKNSDELVGQLRALVSLHEETLPTVRGINFPDLQQIFKDEVQAQLARDRWRLEKYLGGNPYVDDLASAEIDS